MKHDEGKRALEPQRPVSLARPGLVPAPGNQDLPWPSYRRGYAEQPHGNGRANLLRNAVTIVLRHRRLVLGVTLMVLAGSAMLTLLTTPIYRSTVSIQIDREVARVAPSEGVQPVETNDPGFYPTQYELLRSRTLAGRVVADLGLTGDSRFLQADVPSPWANLRRLVAMGARRLADSGDAGTAGADPGGMIVSTASGSPGHSVATLMASEWKRLRTTLGYAEAEESDAAWTTLDLDVSGALQRLQAGLSLVAGYVAELAAADESDHPPSDFETREAIAVDRVVEGLSIQPVGTSRIVRITYENPDPRVAARIANAVADGFIRTTLDRRDDASSRARSFLQERLRETKLKLDDSEKQLAQYAQDRQIVNVDNGAVSLARANLAKASEALSQAANERLMAEQLWNQARATNGLSLPQILESKAVETRRERRAELAAEYEEGLGTFKPAYPEMLRLKRQIDEIDRQIQEQVDLVKGALQARYAVAARQEDSIRRYLESLKQEVLSFETRNVRYKSLLREVDGHRVLYEGYLHRYREAAVAGGGTNNVSIVDPARVPAAPAEPGMSRNLMVALGLGLFLGILAASAKELFNDTVGAAEDIEPTLGVAILGATPLIASRKGRLDAMLDDSRSGIAESFRSLRTALQFSSEAGAPKSLLITSARPSEGRSTTSQALATSFAQLGMRALLIDADLRCPSLHKAVRPGGGMASGKGLTNYLAGSATLQEVFQETATKNLTFTSAGPVRSDSAELLAGPKMLSLLRIAEEQFDIVIIDGPPIMGAIDVSLLASIAEATLVVFSADQLARSTVRIALNRLKFGRGHLIGGVLNKCDVRKAKTGYGYSYAQEGVPKLS